MESQLIISFRVQNQFTHFDKTDYQYCLLTHQVSNLDSSEPKSDVLPITPWVSVLKTDCKTSTFF